MTTHYSYTSGRLGPPPNPFIRTINDFVRRSEASHTEGLKEAIPFECLIPDGSILARVLGCYSASWAEFPAGNLPRPIAISGSDVHTDSDAMRIALRMFEKTREIRPGSVSVFQQNLARADHRGGGRSNKGNCRKHTANEALRRFLSSACFRPVRIINQNAVGRVLDARAFS